MHTFRESNSQRHFPSSGGSECSEVGAVLGKLEASKEADQGRTLVPVEVQTKLVTWSLVETRGIEKALEISDS